MKKYEEISENRIFTNNEIKKMQEENGNMKKKKDFLNYKLYNIKKRQKKRIKIKENDFKGIKSKLNEIFKQYYEKLSAEKITSIEEFYDIIMISFSLYEQLENISCFQDGETNSEVAEFKKKLKAYTDLSLQKKNNSKYADDVKIEQYDIETEKINIQIDQIRKEIRQFTSVLLSELWADYEKFKKFIEDDEKIRTLAQLTELNYSFEELEETDIFENYNNIHDKLERYSLNIKEYDFSLDREKNIRSNIENIVNSFHKENDIINLMLHFSYANILIKNNIMKFPLISKEYSRNSSLIHEIRTLKYDMLNYYRDTLTYRNTIKINDEMIENQSDSLFYDLLYLQNNRNSFEKRKFNTFDRLESSKGNYNVFLKNGISKIEINGNNVVINCDIDDFIQISNSLEMIEKLKEENEQKKILEFLEKDESYYENRKFKLKSKFMSERNNIINLIENEKEIEEELLRKGMKLIPSERQLVFSLLEKTSDKTENFKTIVKKMLKNPYFTEKIIKSASIEKNNAYNEFCEDILYIEKINNFLINYDIAGLSDKEDSLIRLDNFYNFDISKIEKIYEDTYLGYTNKEEELNALLLTKNVVFFRENLYLEENSKEELKYIYLIRDGKTSIDNIIYDIDNHSLNIKNIYNLTDNTGLINTIKISDSINIELPKLGNLLPIYPVENSDMYLFELSKKTHVVNFQLRNEELISNFSDVTDEEKINIIKEGIKIACQRKNSTEIENLMLSISFFRLYDRFSSLFYR